jgi:uncharacterized protein (TIGR02594 family)
MAEEVPPWLEVMRAITGLSEYENGSNPKIEGMAAYIGRQFPPQADYASQFSDDSIAWCGVATDFCLAACTPPISGPFGPTDTDKWMWADSFRTDPNFVDLGAPVPGCIVVMKREGGNHVTMLEEDLGSTIKCRGGNQSDMVNVATYEKDLVTGWMWPKAYPMPEVPRQELEEGDSGAQVVQVQTILGVHPADGDFGPITDSAVCGYQAACSITADGVVGEQTWEKLDELAAKVARGSDGLPPELVAAISDTARNSSIARYSWEDRGAAPIGFTVGMACSFALALDRLNSEDDAAHEMARPDSNDPDHDVFSWYKDEFDDEGMDNSENATPEERLRHLFAFMIGLGPRESSGRYPEGRDMSASNVSADTAEAGMFQTSWNIRSCNSTIPPLLTQYWNNPCGFREQFREEVELDSDDLGNYGSGGGAQYQFLSKYAPTFHALVTAIGLRNLRQHWGPVNRYEVELRSEADAMLQAVQALYEAHEEGVAPEPPELPEPDQAWVAINATGPVSVKSSGDVHVTVNGEPLKTS